MSTDLIVILALTVTTGIAGALPITFIAVGFHKYLPNRTFIVTLALSLVETACAILYVKAQSTNTGLEALILMPITVAIVAGNLVAIPIARRLQKDDLQ